MLKRVHAVRQAPPLANLLKEAARHSAAEDRIEHRERVAPFVAHRKPARTEDDVGLFGIFGLHERRGREQRRFGLGRFGAAAKIGEGSFEERDDRVVVDVARGGEDDPVRRVARPHVQAQIVARERGNGLGIADRRLADVGARPHRAGEEIVDHIVGRVVVHPDLFEHDLLLFSEFARREGRVKVKL